MALWLTDTLWMAEEIEPSPSGTTNQSNSKLFCETYTFLAG